MAEITGKDATITVGGNTITGSNNFVLTVDTNMVDKTDFESNGWVENLAGNKSATATIDFSWDIPTAGTNQADIQNAVLNGTSAAIVLSPNGTNTYSFTGFFNSFPVTVPQGDRVSVSVSVTATGAVTYA